MYSMKRVEIILSQSIDEDFINACDEKNVGKGFTKIPGIQGRGNSVPKQGDAIWPQLNTQFVVYCKDDEVETLFSIIEELRKKYPTEGASFFVSKEDFEER